MPGRHVAAVPATRTFTLIHAVCRVKERAGFGQPVWPAWSRSPRMNSVVAPARRRVHGRWQRAKRKRSNVRGFVSANRTLLCLLALFLWLAGPRQANCCTCAHGHDRDVFSASRHRPDSCCQELSCRANALSRQACGGTCPCSCCRFQQRCDDGLMIRNQEVSVGGIVLSADRVVRRGTRQTTQGLCVRGLSAAEKLSPALLCRWRC